MQEKSTEKSVKKVRKKFKKNTKKSSKKIQKKIRKKFRKISARNSPQFHLKMLKNSWTFFYKKGEIFMKKNQRNELAFDHVEELLVRISLDLKKEMKGLFGERLDEIHLIILTINQGELINFSQDGFGRQIFTFKMFDNSELKIQRAMERMPFTHHDVIEEDARWWSILSHKQEGSLD